MNPGPLPLPVTTAPATPAPVSRPAAGGPAPAADGAAAPFAGALEALLAVLAGQGGAPPGQGPAAGEPAAADAAPAAGEGGNPLPPAGLVLPLPGWPAPAVEAASPAAGPGPAAPAGAPVPPALAVLAAGTGGPAGGVPGQGHEGAEEGAAGMESLLRPSRLAALPQGAPEVPVTLPPAAASGGEAAVAAGQPGFHMAAQAPAAQGPVPASSPVPVPPQSPAWGQEVAQRVHWMVSQQVQQAEIRLDPPELGSLEVRISVSRDQAHVNFASVHAPVREALEAALPRLREMLAEQGLNLVQAEVFHQSFAQQRDHSTGDGGSGRPGTPEDPEAGPAATVAAPGPVAAGRGLLDLYA